MFDTPFIVPVVAIIAWAVVAVMRSKHGASGRYTDVTSPDGKAPPSVAQLVERAMAERDEEIRELRKRVQVLEKIAIDTHKSHHLSEEIEKLQVPEGDPAR